MEEKMEENYGDQNFINLKVKNNICVVSGIKTYKVLYVSGVRNIESI